RRRHTRSKRDWSSDVCSSDLNLRLHWPWYARINVLGEFSLRLRGQQESVLSGGKQGTNKLLSYLIAAGPNGMAQETLAASLWPEIGRASSRDTQSSSWGGAGG